MLPCFTEDSGVQRLIEPLSPEKLTSWLDSQPVNIQNWVKANDFTAKLRQVCLLPDSEGTISTVLLGIDHEESVGSFAGLAKQLPEGCYRINLTAIDPALHWKVFLYWALDSYCFSRYKKKHDQSMPVLVLADKTADVYAKGIYLVRDLVNTPAEDMSPVQLSAKAKEIALTYDARYQEIVGEDLLSKNYPAIYHVGRAGSQAPRLIDMSWGDPAHKKIVLVGKGVCFDSGGLDLKPSSNMRLMKKDMGGAAHVLGLAQLIMAMKLPLHLRVLIPAVENAIDGNAYRPGDVLSTRKGLSVEVGNTDAEGRLVLADALAEAVESGADYIIDFATLTGAARVALGTEVPVYFTNSDPLSLSLEKAAQSAQEAIWRLPLHKPYRSYIDSSIADLCNDASTPYGGAITAALFLQEFVGNAIPWIHFDIMAWNLNGKPGHPEGGEAMGLLACYKLIEDGLLSD